MDRPSVIRKTAADLRLPPNLADYAATRASFRWPPVGRSWPACRAAASTSPTRPSSATPAGRCATRTAFRFLGAHASRDITYGELSRLTNRFANVLKSLGIGKGERLFLLSGRIPELYVAVLGSFKNGTVVSPLFSAFGPEPIATRIKLGEGAVLVTTELLYERKVAKIRDQLPTLRHVLLVGEEGQATSVPGTLDLATLMAQADDEFDIVPTDAGRPLAAALHQRHHRHAEGRHARARRGGAHWATGKYALDLHADDIYWCTADPGWVTGTSYGIIAPLLHGVTSIVDEADFDAERWYDILHEQNVSVWYTAPTAIRMLMKAGAEVARSAAIRTALRRQRRRAAQSGGGVVGQGGAGPAHPRQLVADRDGRHHDRQHAGLRHQARLDGTPLPGIEAAIVQPMEKSVWWRRRTPRANWR
jgi:acetyl-CoA synthetase